MDTDLPRVPEYLPFPPTERRALVPPSEYPPATFARGTEFAWSDCTPLSAALVAVGCVLRTDPPYTYKLVKGKPVVHWHHVSCSAPNGKGEVFKTKELMAAWSNDIEWAVKFPDHPFTMAMHAIKNLRAMTDHLNNDVPYVNFRNPAAPGITFSVKYGSKKHKKAIELGLTQI